MGATSRRTVNTPRTTSGISHGLARALLLAWIWCVRCEAGFAQAPADAPVATSDPAAYVEAIDRAVAAYEAGDYAKAHQHFAAAHEISPNARTLRGLGKAEFELRNYGKSLSYLEASLSAQQKPLDDRLREEVSTLAARARAYVGELHVSVEPGTATVSIDGVKVASGPEASLSLLIGDHMLEFHAIGHLPETRSVRIAAGQRTSVHVALATPRASAEPLPMARATPARPVKDSGSPAWRRTWLWAAVGVVAAGAAVGLLFGLQRGSVEREADPVSTANTPPGSTIQTLGAR